MLPTACRSGAVWARWFFSLRCGEPASLEVSSDLSLEVDDSGPDFSLFSSSSLSLW